MKISPSALRWPALICLGLFALGCRSDSLVERSLIFFTNTTVGLEMSASPADAAGPFKLVLGYRRAEGVIDPVYHPEGVMTSPTTRTTVDGAAAGGTTTTTTTTGAVPRYLSQAYSVIARINGDVGGGTAAAANGKISFAQWFATGKAAEIVAGNSATPGALIGSTQATIAGAVPLAAVKSADRAKQAELDVLLTKKLKPIDVDANHKFKADQVDDYADFLADKIVPGSTWLQIRTAGGSDLDKLIAQLRSQIQD